jgi:hypothetical protein
MDTKWRGQVIHKRDNARRKQEREGVQQCAEPQVLVALQGDPSHSDKKSRLDTAAIRTVSAITRDGEAWILLIRFLLFVMDILTLHDSQLVLRSPCCNFLLLHGKTHSKTFGIVTVARLLPWLR